MHNDSESEIEEGPLSEYEKQRLENVERNKKRFQEMNLSSFDQFLQAKKKETENKKSVSNFYDSDEDDIPLSSEFHFLNRARSSVGAWSCSCRERAALVFAARKQGLRETSVLCSLYIATLYKDSCVYTVSILEAPTNHLLLFDRRLAVATVDCRRSNTGATRARA